MHPIVSLASTVAIICSLSGCALLKQQEAKQVAGETVVGEGKVAVLNSKRLLIEEKVSVVALDLDEKSGNMLSSQYQAGQPVKLMGEKTLDKDGNSQSTIKAIVFADGRRFNISQ